MKKVFFAFVLLALINGCDTSSKENKKRPLVRRKKTEVLSPKRGSKITSGDTLLIHVTPKTPDLAIQSLVMTGESLKHSVALSNDQLSFDSKAMPVGFQSLLVKVQLSDGTTETHHLTIQVLSDIIPTKYSYRLVKKYPHDTDSYTQGLFFHQDTLYEGTGNWEDSELHKIDWRTGKVLSRQALGNNEFGEGITIWNDKIYQLTWKARKGYVYDLNFKRTNSFNYPTEGWGLTTMGDTLVMSSGSNYLHFKNPFDFSEYASIQVYDQDGPVDSLNELEYVDGKIWANVYQEDYIAIIDPTTGKVTGKLDLTGIFDRSSYHQEVDVLNGIAYHPDTQTYFVTGKWWPYLYEIQISSPNS